MSYSWLTFGQAKTELSVRLNDPSFVYTTNAEAGLYIALALRMWNCLTAFWISEYSTTLAPPLAANWIQANGSGSPRQPSLSDLDLYTWIEYMLLEPPTGGTWTGTTQFTIAGLAQAVRGRRDEAIQHGATNVAEISIAMTPNTSRVTLPDNVLDVTRVRYVPVSGSPITLNRGDAESFRTFTPSYPQTVSQPLRWDVISGPPLALTLDSYVPVPVSLEILTVQSGAIPAPPAATLLNVPDDWTWVTLFGALYDLLSAQEESKDEQRAQYCQTRYREGLEMLRRATWLLEGRVNNVPVDTPSVVSADRFNYGWQANASAFPAIVVGGMDLYAVCPVPTLSTSVTLSLVGNAPIPASDFAMIQVPRDVMDAILDEAEHLAQFKRGASDLMASVELHKSFLDTAQRWDSRIRQSGIFPTTLRSQVTRGEEQQPRFSKEK